MLLYCCSCKKKVNAQLTKGSVIYPSRSDLSEKQFYMCPHCGCYVGCHAHSNRPLGCIPNAEIKRARRFIHDLIDPLWKEHGIPRKVVYSYISSQLGYTYHTGETRSIEECRDVYRIGLNFKKRYLPCVKKQK